MGRPLFWQIHPVWAFYLLAAIALGVFGVGLYVRIAPWKKNLGALRSGFHPSGIKALFTDGLLGKKIWAGDVPAGLMHFLIFAGFLLLFLGTLILSADHYLKLKFLQGAVYLWYSACLEVAGVMLLAGLVWAAVRRYLQRVPRLENRPEDALVLFWLGLAAFSGFLIEALRLAAMQPDWRQWSFIGDLVSRWFDPDQARPLYPYFWWLHAFLSLGLVAYIPFSKLFHVL
ncbi:MAG: respiratory nitrate reductase subunit gamma, partial [Desulfobacterales bacterium]|nr:respiratory nitrate reductase subunit gamma [Desulfobacterales bacterium]